MSGCCVWTWTRLKLTIEQIVIFKSVMFANKSISITFYWIRIRSFQHHASRAVLEVTSWTRVSFICTLYQAILKSLLIATKCWPFRFWVHVYYCFNLGRDWSKMFLIISCWSRTFYQISTNCFSFLPIRGFCVWISCHWIAWTTIHLFIRIQITIWVWGLSHVI